LDAPAAGTADDGKRQVFPLNLLETLMTATKEIVNPETLKAGPPTAELANLSYSDGTSNAMARAYRYATRNHTLRDVLREGYFDAAALEWRFKVWDEIHITCGSDPAEAWSVVLRVVKVPGLKSMSRSERLAQGEANIDPHHIRFCIVHRSKPSAVMHDGEVADDKPSRKAA